MYDIILAIYKYIYPISVLCRWLVSVEVEDVYIDIKIFIDFRDY